mmetsp:Transcript_5862/g.12559  ORF Transcript_5862/g.12559 Transcript_5862/m.12559 type:complete len:84 (-) Transcript_5862:50-301(-)
MMRESTPDEGRVAVGSLLAAISGRPASATIFEPLGEDNSAVHIVMPSEDRSFDAVPGEDGSQMLGPSAAAVHDAQHVLPLASP